MSASASGTHQSDGWHSVRGKATSTSGGRGGASGRGPVGPAAVGGRGGRGAGGAQPKRPPAEVPRPEGLRPAQTTDVLCENLRPPGKLCKFKEEKGRAYSYPSLVSRLAEEVEDELLDSEERGEVGDERSRAHGSEQQRRGPAAEAKPAPLPSSSEAFSEAFPLLLSRQAAVAAAARPVAPGPAAAAVAAATGRPAPVAVAPPNPTTPQPMPQAAAIGAQQSRGPAGAGAPSSSSSSSLRTNGALDGQRAASGATSSNSWAGYDVGPLAAQLGLAAEPALLSPRAAPPSPGPVAGAGPAASACAGPLRDLPDLSAIPAFMCPISLAQFEDPVVAADGITYERSEITDWLFRQQKDTSPCTGERLAHKHLVRNTTLRAAMREVADLLAGLQVAQPAGSMV
eukprot:scaffold6.g2896.t1